MCETSFRRGIGKVTLAADKNCIPINTLESPRKVLNALNRKTSLSKGFSQCRTAKILDSRLLGLSLHKSREKCFHI